jgi:hypothetical protein
LGPPLRRGYLFKELVLEYILSTEYDGRLRKLYPKTCSCGKVYCVPRNQLARRKHCSKSCSSLARVRQIDLTCEVCGRTFTRTPSDLKLSKSGLFFCSRACKDQAQSLGGLSAIQPSHYGKGNGAHDYRERAMRYYGAKCQSCGYDQDHRMLDVDHIDDDRLNNNISNLQVLCVWCHALKTRGVEQHSCPGSLAMENES